MKTPWGVGLSSSQVGGSNLLRDLSVCLSLHVCPPNPVPPSQPTCHMWAGYSLDGWVGQGGVFLLFPFATDKQSYLLHCVGTGTEGTDSPECSATALFSAPPAHLLLACASRGGDMCMGWPEETHFPNLLLLLWVSCLRVHSQTHTGGPFCALQFMDTSCGSCILSSDSGRNSQSLVLQS